MGHLLLTGATGLLGRFLLKDLLVRDVPLAVLVRPSRKNEPWQRIEAAVRMWEADLGRELPRPKVLAGDISDSDLRLTGPQLRWVAENCDSLLHNAASLSFVATGPDSEPWRSNLGGTRNVLEFCQQAGIETLHHVSTAYVAGKRFGRVYETELDLGQEFANPYEESKLRAEQLVRDAAFLKDVTIYRPAIIVGDSRTGVTFTYHNFYALLQLAYTLATSMTAPNYTGKSVVPSFHVNCDGHERKNLVPVDWVSEVMARIITTPALHGQTYHLTPRVPVTVRLLIDVIEETVGLYGLRFSGADAVMGKNEVESIVLQQMEVYQSYFKDDPEFDSTNTQAAVPDLLCPHVDREMLTRLATTAIEKRFSWRDPKVTASPAAALV